MDTEQAYANFCRFEPPQMQAVICLNRANPECSPPGTTILSATSLAGPEAWREVRPEQYYDVKNYMAEAMVRQLADYLDATPGHTASPQQRKVGCLFSGPGSI